MPHLPGQKGRWGSVAKDNRLFINAVLWILRSGAAWRELPPDYEHWKKEQREYDNDLYKLRHLIENAFMYLKRWLSVSAIFRQHTS